MLIEKDLIKELRILNQLIYKIWVEMKASNDISALIRDHAMAVEEKLDKEDGHGQKPEDRPANSDS